MTTCTAEDHARLRADPAALRLHTTPLGVQCDENNQPAFELRICHVCRSSLAAPIDGVPMPGPVCRPGTPLAS